MKTIIASVILGSSLIATAHADGFVCQTIPGDIQVNVYNQTQPALGTRNVAVMVVSDPRVHPGRKTIAKFSNIKGTAANSGAFYQSKVDLRFSDSTRSGELIGPTKLGQLNAIQLHVNFSYASPLLAGDKTTGILSLIKRDGDLIQLDVDCTRYLKN